LQPSVTSDSVVLLPRACSISARRLLVSLLLPTTGFPSAASADDDFATLTGCLQTNVTAKSQQNPNKALPPQKNYSTGTCSASNEAMYTFKAINDHADVSLHLPQCSTHGSHSLKYDKLRANSQVLIISMDYSDWNG